MKKLDPGLQAHLSGRATTMCYCWKVTRTDGVTQGFTDHDNPLTFGGLTYLASSGFTASQVVNSLGLAVDNLEVEGALSSATINEDDLARGLYDGAKVVVYWVNWKNLSQRQVFNQGTLGEVKRGGLAFKAELRGLANALQQKTGRKYAKYCDAIVGDTRCGIDLTQPTYRGFGTVGSIQNNRVFSVSGLGSYSDDWFTAGVLTFTSGGNISLKHSIKLHQLSGGVVMIELWEPALFDLAPGDGLQVTAGCKQDAKTCAAKFGNITNFRGFNLIPGQDALLYYPNQGEANLDGGSMFTKVPTT